MVWSLLLPLQTSVLRPVENFVLPIAADRTGVAVYAVQAVIFGDLGRVQRRLLHHGAIVFRTLGW